jgi:intracellular multiplication protein IcmX
MRKVYGLALSLILIAMTSLVIADEYAQADTGTESSESEDLDLLVKYTKNLGIYLGFDLTTDGLDISSPPTASQALVQDPPVSNIEYYALMSVFGALPVNNFFPTFVSTTNQVYSALNDFANNNFKSYSSADATDKVSASSLVDQPISQGSGYQSDPVTQAVFNILATPDYSFCMDIDSTSKVGTWKDNCLYQGKVMANAIGGDLLPSEGQVYQNLSDETYYGQLNSNVLIAPLLYAVDTSNNANQKQAGLPATNQLQEAVNFIRYSTGAVSPIAQIKKSDYAKLFANTIPASNSSEDMMTAADNQASLASYLTGLRVYAAQSSAAIGNLYYILSKRISQPTEKSGSSSQALLEYQMATWRLNRPGQDSGSSWLSQINNASDSTVQKEIAILLAEINYQLYLNRQQEERNLLNSSMILLTLLMQNKPLPPSADSVPTSSE